MPELPEVFTFQQYFNRHGLHNKIIGCQFHRPKILKDITPEMFSKNLVGKQFTETYRQGKYLFPRLNTGEYILIHFGMTGDLHAYTIHNGAPQYERMCIYFKDDTVLGFIDMRLFGKIQFICDLEKFLLDLGLGVDALVISASEFYKIWNKARGTLKSFLMNQKHLAGIGNLYADEICFQSKIHPASQIQNIPDLKIKEIFSTMKTVLKSAVSRLPDYQNYPEDWFWSWRKDGSVSPDGKSTITKSKVAGRTTYYFPEWQKLY